jgi:hypothetical protein
MQYRRTPTLKPGALASRGIARRGPWTVEIAHYGGRERLLGSSDSRRPHGGHHAPMQLAAAQEGRATLGSQSLTQGDQGERMRRPKGCNAMRLWSESARQILDGRWSSAIFAAFALWGPARLLAIV